MLLYRVIPENKFVRLGSLLSEDVAWFFHLYSISNAKWNHSFIYEGGYYNQPAIMTEAFGYMDSVYNELERKRMQAAKKQQAQREAEARAGK